MAKKPAVKHKIAYAGKGKKNPMLPAGAVSDITISQGGDAYTLVVSRRDEGILFDRAVLLGVLDLKPAAVKELPVIDVQVEGVKKPVAYLSYGNAVLVAAVARATKGSSPVTQWLLGSALAGLNDRLVAAVPELGALPEVVPATPVA